jgi:starch synthase
MNQIKVLLVASEVAPFAKTGGLADVTGSLPKYLKRLGVDVRIVMPKYKAIPESFTKVMEYAGYTYVDVGWRHQYCGILKLEYDGIPVYFIDNEYYFSREGLYGYHDEGEQYTYFCKAVLEFLPKVDFKPDVIHCNDWQTGIIPLLLKAQYSQKPFFSEIKTLFTIHNLKYQGVFPKEIMDDLLNLGWEYYTMDGIEYFDHINFMKSGLVYSDLINTVSMTYAEEIKCDFLGEGLNSVLQKRSGDLSGILNGIDREENDPTSDKRLFAPFDANHPEGKYENKRRLQESLGLPLREDIPVIGIISRLVDQKGFDLIECVMREILELDIQLILLGTGDPRYESMFLQAASAYPAKASANIKYDGTLAQQIYAGSDLFLMPSLFEPCGLSQLFSLRYGTLPIVRETGGLNDTIQSYNELTGEGNGFSFTSYNAHDMLYTIQRAVNLYQDRELWLKLVKRALEQDFSWDRSAEEYMELYRKAINRGKAD